MRIAITGHRPNKLSRTQNDYLDALKDAYGQIGATYVYEGQAAGIDLYAAYAAHVAGIPYEAVLPYKGHREFNKSWYNWYDGAIKYADRVEILSDSVDYPGPWAFHNRNHYMVDHADAVLAVWDGQRGGGTAACVDYAWKREKTIYRIDPHTLEFSCL